MEDEVPAALRPDLLLASDVVYSPGGGEGLMCSSTTATPSFSVVAAHHQVFHAALACLMLGVFIQVH
jgi:hypothetical protein